MKNFNENYLIGGVLLLVVYFLFIRKKTTKKTTLEPNRTVAIDQIYTESYGVEKEAYNYSPNIVDTINNSDRNTIAIDNLIPDEYDPTTETDPFHEKYNVVLEQYADSHPAPNMPGELIFYDPRVNYQPTATL